MFPDDTIVATATPPGQGGVSILRISGKHAFSIAEKITQHNNPPIQKVSLRTFYNEKNQVIDEGLLLLFEAPHSFTGENIAEFHTHGSPVVQEMLIESAIFFGARMATPGEFSLRAFLNEKIDLTQAEAVADLIHASSRQAARAAMQSLQGHFSNFIVDLNQQLISARVIVEAILDFPDEEDTFSLEISNIEKLCTSVLNALDSSIEKSNHLLLLNQGIQLCIIGLPNAGKSSLLNALLGYDAAIVTNIPGTTRDVIRDHWFLNGFKIQVLDTAGIRFTEDVIEKEGITRAIQEAQKAHIVVVIEDASCDTHAQSQHLFDFLKDSETPLVSVKNKIDLLSKKPWYIKNEIGVEVGLSALTRQGIEHFERAIIELLHLQTETEASWLSRKRHVEALKQARIELKQALLELKQKRLELCAEQLRLTQQALESITGRFTSDDLLGEIFSTFCMGK